MIAATGDFLAERRGAIQRCPFTRQHSCQWLTDTLLMPTVRVSRYHTGAIGRQRYDLVMASGLAV